MFLCPSKSKQCNCIFYEIGKKTQEHVLDNLIGQAMLHNILEKKKADTVACQHWKGEMRSQAQHFI